VVRIVATILCIDDSRNILEVQQVLLENKGHRVLIAPDGPTGIALSREHSVDVVVLDFNMPGMNGDQVAQVMAQEQPTLPVVIWSGYTADVPESLRWFAYAVLHKGDGPDVLLSVIESLVKAGGISQRALAGPSERLMA
jgi:DNA-binding NtrC family response regulator